MATHFCSDPLRLVPGFVTHLRKHFSVIFWKQPKIKTNSLNERLLDGEKKWQLVKIYRDKFLSIGNGNLLPNFGHQLIFLC